MSLFDEVISNSAAERPAFRQAPPGDYLVAVRGTKIVKANTGTEGIKMEFTLREAMHSEAMEGVDLSKCRLEDTLWVTDKTLENVKTKLARINSDTQGGTLRDALDVLPGSEVVVRLSHETHQRDGTPLNTPRLKVEGFYTIDWYMNNKRAA